MIPKTTPSSNSGSKKAGLLQSWDLCAARHALVMLCNRRAMLMSVRVCHALSGFFKRLFSRSEEKTMTVGNPTNFIHKSHIGFDPEKGFDVRVCRVLCLVRSMHDHNTRSGLCFAWLLSDEMVRCDANTNCCGPYRFRLRTCPRSGRICSKRRESRRKISLTLKLRK